MCGGKRYHAENFSKKNVGASAGAGKVDRIAQRRRGHTHLRTGRRRVANLTAGIRNSRTVLQGAKTAGDIATAIVVAALDGPHAVAV